MSAPGKKPKKSRRARQKVSPKRARQVERVVQAIELRKAGNTFVMIGNALGVSGPRAYQMVTEGLRATLCEPAEELKKLEVERLDHMLTAIWPQAQNGDLNAQSGVLRLMERRDKYFALSAPTKMEFAGPGGGPQEHRVSVEDASQSFNAKAGLVLEKMRKAREGQT